MMYDLFSDVCKHLANILLTVCKHLFENFCICIHQGYWPVVFVVVVVESLSSFAVRVMLALWNESARVPSLLFPGRVCSVLALLLV